ncbi:MAG: DUF2142 domain-containing protein [Janthinobacterium lividum]
MMLRPSLLAAVFLLCAAPVLMFLAVLVPTGEIPDEVAHVVRMESLLHGNLIGYRGERPDLAGNTVPDAGVTANAGLLAAGFSFHPGTPLAERVLDRAARDRLLQLPWAPAQSFVSIPNTAVYPPLFYVPGAVAIGLARLADANPYAAIIGARLVNAALYLALGLAALLLARRGRAMLLATLLLPISLWLAASCNADGLIIATAVLAAALLTRQRWTSWWGAALCVAAIIMAKPTYVPLVLPVAALMPLSGAQWAARALACAGTALPGVAWYVLAQLRAAVPFVRGAPFQAGPYWPGDPNDIFTVVDPALQVRVLLHQPWLMVLLPVQTLWANAKWYGLEIVGILGILDIVLPYGLYLLWFAALAGAVLAALVDRGEPGDPGDRTRPAGPVARLAVLAGIVAAVFALFDGQYLSWTHTGATVVEGVQGRYFVPLLPFLMLVPPALLRGPAAVRAVLQAPLVLAGLAGLMLLPALVVWTYYLR